MCVRPLLSLSSRLVFWVVNITRPIFPPTKRRVAPQERVRCRTRLSTRSLCIMLSLTSFSNTPRRADRLLRQTLTKQYLHAGSVHRRSPIPLSRANLFSPSSTTFVLARTCALLAPSRRRRHCNVCMLCRGVPRCRRGVQRCQRRRYRHL